jgi:hypothetical protein
VELHYRTKVATLIAAVIVQQALMRHPPANPSYAGRVEERRGFPVRSRFPSPLIERSVRISRTTLSD